MSRKLQKLLTLNLEHVINRKFVAFCENFLFMTTNSVSNDVDLKIKSKTHFAKSIPIFQQHKQDAIDVNACFLEQRLHLF